jgi:hypothetical protein
LGQGGPLFMKVHSWNQVEREPMTTGIARQVIHSGRMTTARIFMEEGYRLASRRK